MSNLLKVSYRGGFSDRNKIDPVNTEIQFTEFDQRTRVDIVNTCNKLFNFRMSNEYQYRSGNSFECKFVRYFLSEVYAQAVDSNAIYSSRDFFKNIFNKTILEDSYDSVLTLVEVFCNQLCSEYGLDHQGMDFNFPIDNAIHPEKVFNELFEKEYVGYRFVNRNIVKITDKTEINEVEDAVRSPYDVVNYHINKALQCLANREKPDYENSIKESITAIEALCEIVTGMHSSTATLGSMLKKLEKNGIEMHGALKSAFTQLYGYTCDANGIRHAGDIGGPNSTFEEAKFMLVSSSAFINYIIGVWTKKEWEEEY